MTTRDPYEDPQQYDDLWGGENFPGHMVNPPEPDVSKWRARSSAGAWLAVVGLAVAVWAAVFYVAFGGVR